MKWLAYILLMAMMFIATSCSFSLRLSGKEVALEWIGEFFPKPVVVTPQK